MQKITKQILISLILSINCIGTLAFGQADIEARAQAMDKKLIAPCCWAKTLDQEQSREAVEMKEELRMKLAQGQSEEQIMKAFGERFGERIFAEPTKTGFNIMVWIFPMLALGSGVIILSFVLRKKPQPTEEITDTLTLAANTPEKDEKYKQMIDKELYRSDD